MSYRLGVAGGALKIGRSTESVCVLSIEIDLSWLSSMIEGGQGWGIGGKLFDERVGVREIESAILVTWSAHKGLGGSV